MNMNTPLINRSITRRTFIKTTTAATVGMTALSARRVLGANERVNVGIIGVGLIGRIQARAFAQQPDVQITGISETYQPRMELGVELSGGKAKRFPDFRKMLENKEIDAVVVATPDHWHGLQTMLACAAGKDVYVEKPFCHFIQEGRWMVEVARRNKRVIQVGTQNRSGPTFERARQLLQGGAIGEIVSIQANFFRNLMPGLGYPPDGNPPENFDWEMFNGPARERPYNPLRGIYNFRWFWDTSGGQVTNLGQHSLDVVHWFTGVNAPKSVFSAGGRFFLKDICETPDTQDIIIEYPGFQAVCQYREATAGKKGVGMGGLVFFGTKGSMCIDRSGFEISADEKQHPINTFASIIGGHPVGGPQRIEEPADQLWTEPVLDQTGDAPGDYVRHVRNFVDCVKSRKEPAVTAETGHRVATVCHLANISLKTGRKLNWDADKELIKDDPDANKMMVLEYRKPWDAELKALVQS